MNIKPWIKSKLIAAQKTFVNFRTTRAFRRNINNRLKQQPVQKETFEYTNPLIPSYKDTRWHQVYYNANGIKSDFYLPEDIFHICIEPVLNPRDRIATYEDKNIFDKFIFPCKFPQTFGRIINGGFLSEDYMPADPIKALQEKEDVVIKPSRNTYGGSGILFLDGKDAANFANEVMEQNPKVDYIFQEPVKQSANLAAFSSDSVNTVRILTLYKEGNVHTLSSYLRIGKKGSRLDHVCRGGLACGVAIDTGCLIDRAYDFSFSSVYEHEETKIKFDGYKIEGFKEARELCQKLHQLIPELGLVSWDIAFDTNNKPIVIELNVTEIHIMLHQVSHGPIFEKHLDWILERINPKMIFNHTIG